MYDSSFSSIKSLPGSHVWLFLLLYQISARLTCMTLPSPLSNLCQADMYDSSFSSIKSLPGWHVWLFLLPPLSYLSGSYLWLFLLLYQISARFTCMTLPSLSNLCQVHMYDSSFPSIKSLPGSHVWLFFSSIKSLPGSHVWLFLLLYQISARLTSTTLPSPSSIISVRLICMTLPSPLSNLCQVHMHDSSFSSIKSLPGSHAWLFLLLYQILFSMASFSGLSLVSPVRNDDVNKLLFSTFPKSSYMYFIPTTLLFRYFL